MLTSNRISMFASLLILTSVMLLFSGCASMSRKRVPVKFSDPADIVVYKTLPPDANEKKGVLLRLKPQVVTVKYHDDIQIFTQIKDNTAVSINIPKTRIITYDKGEKPGTFYINTVTITEKDGMKRGDERILVDSRGKILKFVKGDFITERGTLKFLSRTRTSIFPEKPVVVGDSWKYEESLMDVYDSWMISKKSDKPQKINITCTLKGFADFKGRRCAVISTRTVTSREEVYSTLLKDIKIRINIYMQETDLFDYRTGIYVANVTKTNSFSTSTGEDKGFSDESKTQTVSKLIPNSENTK